jgi:hypothetical protein
MNNLPALKTENILLKPNVLEEVKNDVFNIVNGSIAQCFAHLNYPVPTDSNYLVNEVTDSIIKKFPSMRMQEIPVAFANGIRKMYGDYFGLSVVTFEGFITGYLNSPKRVELVKEKVKMIDYKPEPTADEKFTTGKNLATDLFEVFKRSGQFGLSVLAVYEFINSLGLIDKEYKTVYQEAMELTVVIKKQEIANCMDIYKRRRLNVELEFLTDNIEKDMLTKEQHNEVLRTGKKIILKNWFQDLIVNEDSLDELIENCRPNNA